MTSRTRMRKDDTLRDQPAAPLQAHNQRPMAARRKDRMIDTQQEYRKSTPTRVIPALLHIQELEQPGRTAEEPQRRITVLLDHPVVKQVGWFSWSLAIVALAATRPVAAIPISVLVLAGLLVGAINASRWLFSQKR